MATDKSKPTHTVVQDCRFYEHDEEGKPQLVVEYVKGQHVRNPVEKLVRRGCIVKGIK